MHQIHPVQVQLWRLASNREITDREVADMLMTEAMERTRFDPTVPLLMQAAERLKRADGGGLEKTYV